MAETPNVLPLREIFAEVGRDYPLDLAGHTEGLDLDMPSISENSSGRLGYADHR